MVNKEKLLVSYYKEPKKSYTKVANRLIRNDEMSNFAFRVYCYIASTNQDRFTLSAAGIARNLKKSRSSVNDAINELEELGHLTRILETKNKLKFHLFSTPKGVSKISQVTKNQST